MKQKTWLLLLLLYLITSIPFVNVIDYHEIENPIKYNYNDDWEDTKSVKNETSENMLKYDYLGIEQPVFNSKSGGVTSTKDKVAAGLAAGAE